MKRLLLIIVLLLLPSPSWAQASLLQDLQVARSHYGASLTPTQVAEMLNGVAWAHRAEGWGMLRKGSGNSCPLRDTFISCDILIHSPTIQHFDVLIDAEGRAEPTWNLVGPCVLGPSSGCEMSRYLAPFDPGGTPSPNPGPIQPTPGTPVDLSRILERLDTLQAHGDSNDQSLRDALERMFAQWQLADTDARKRDADILEHVDNPGWFKQVVSSRYFQVIVASVATWLGVKAAQ